MNRIAFYKYDKKEENGEYLKFTSASDQELDDLYINDIFAIITQITNPELKTKMKYRLLKYLKGNKILFDDAYYLSLGIFNEDEIKSIVSSIDYTKKIQDDIINDKIRDYKIIPIIKNFFYSSDSTWIIGNISAIFLLIKEFDIYDSVLINTLEYSLEKDKRVFKMLLDIYKSSLPKYYLKYLEINNDNNYLYNKSREYRSLHLRIGIDPKISIAPEIEANNHNNLTIDFYSQNGLNNRYTTHNDATLPDGKEINCIPFHDTEEDLATFKVVCDSLKDIGYYYNTENGNAAGQINLGLSYLDSAEAIINFYEIFGNVEELLFYISNKKGELTRQSLYQNSRFKPIGEILGKRILDEDITREEVIRLFNSTFTKSSGIKELTYKKNTLCLRGEYEDNYRFEIRIPNGGVDYETWIDNIRLYGKMMEVAKKIADACKKEYLTQEEERMLRLKLDLEDKSLSLNEKLDILMNLLFSDEEIKKIYYERFDSVIEQLNNSQDYTTFEKYYVPSKRIEPMFDEVGFQGKFKSKLNEEPVAVYDPETNEYLEYGEKKHLR